VDDELRIEVALERITESSIHVQYNAYVANTGVAKATSRYVCLDSETGKPAALPDGITRA
jgi:acyl-CoA thioesterase FadM